MYCTQFELTKTVNSWNQSFLCNLKFRSREGIVCKHPNSQQQQQQQVIIIIKLLFIHYNMITHTTSSFLRKTHISNNYFWFPFWNDIFLSRSYNLPKLIDSFNNVVGSSYVELSHGIILFIFFWGGKYNLSYICIFKNIRLN